MRTLIFIGCLFYCSSVARADDWHRISLRLKINSHTLFRSPYCSEFPPLPTPPRSCGMPLNPLFAQRFERPKGAIFCRMEDYLIAKTKVWIKVGVK